MAEPDYANYAKCMEEIKRRQHAIDDILAGRRATTFKYTNLEFVGLQFRKIFELIVLATLASHQHLFEGMTRKFSKEWEIAKVVNLVKKKNPGFYPKPIDRVSTTKAGVKDDWIDVSTGFLTLSDLILAHGKIGNIMHATNPYREETLISEFEAEFSEWRSKTVRLLDNHLVEFQNKTVLYVGMQSIETGHVHTMLFAKQS